jgi:putative membrane protein
LKRISANLIGLNIVFSGQLLTIWLISLFVPELTVNSIYSAAAFLMIYLVSQMLFWWLFIRYLVRLPYFLYPIFTFILNGAFVALFTNLILEIDTFRILDGILMTISLSVTNTILGGFLRIREFYFFDQVIIRSVVRRTSYVNITDEPGWIYIEIDGLGETVLKNAIDLDYMPTLKRWISTGSYQISGWETDYSSQTGSMQAGILFGNNENIPAYRWWNRAENRVMMSGDPLCAKEVEERQKKNKNLLTEEGASRGNMYSGGAGDSLFTISALLDNQASPSKFYLFLFNPIIFAYELTRFILEILEEFVDSFLQRFRKEEHKLPFRYHYYGIFRAFMGGILHDVVSYVSIGDIARGIPDMYIAYSGYDDLSHFAGPETPEAYRMLKKIDQHIVRIEKAVKQAPRPYHVVVLSDHGQSEGLTFGAKYGVELQDYVKQLMVDDHSVAAMMETEEAWKRISALLSDAANLDRRTTRFLRTMLASKTQNGIVTLEKRRENGSPDGTTSHISSADFIILASGCMGLFYVNKAKKRLSYEQIQSMFPDLIPGLISHPGIGFLLVNSERDGALAIGKEGINFLDAQFVEGIDPLSGYGQNAAMHARRLNSFTDCPDIVLNTVYNPETEEISSLEYQVGHHGGLGGAQSHAFLLYPGEFSVGEKAIICAETINQILRQWRGEKLE